MDRSQLLNDNEASLRLALDGRQSTLWTAIPCIVESVNLSEMTISAQPAIQGSVENEDGTSTNVDLPLLIHVPIVFPGAGGFILTFPIATGDEVLVVFASRCIDSWWQSGGSSNRPMEMRMHDLSDGFAIPGPRSQPKTVSGISSTKCQLRNEAGTTYLEINAAGKISLVSPSEIDITAPSIVLTGSVSVIGALDATGNLSTDMNLIADLAVTAVGGALTGASLAITGSGAAAIGGALTAASVVAGGKNLATHTLTAGTYTNGGGAVTGVSGAPV